MTKYLKTEVNLNRVRPIYLPQLQSWDTKIWKSQPCHIVKVRINNFSIYHGSFHTLKGNGLVNDEVQLYVTDCVYKHTCFILVFTDCQCIPEINCFDLWELFYNHFPNYDCYDHSGAIKE